MIGSKIDIQYFVFEKGDNEGDVATAFGTRCKSVEIKGDSLSKIENCRYP
ncbi:MAG TPA: hypothetical protein VJ250_00860 [Nitrososphaeraceae archaeon]|nr:hypothetical protein [Nitrososphaeraceae archaeon]